ncbi:GC-rich sequence DNA-binding factor-like protein [Tasmannia lanceolata]|uniref:GC-rich sequence DNA-binding factor-like protein n=1 Tax=Tasmannia lanceolata TaxID=3420 RepID=UPI004062ACB7
MSNRGKNFRRRAEEDETNGEENIETPNFPTKVSKDAKKRQPKIHQAPKLLSFADDEDAATGISSRTHKDRDRDRSFSRSNKSSLSSSSHKITTIKDRISSSSPSVPSNVQSQPGEYTVERLRELQKNTRTLAASSKPPSQTKSTSEPVVILKGLLKPVPALHDEAEAETPSFVITEEEKENSEFRMEKDNAEQRLASMGIGKVGRDSTGSLIPDQAAIDAIKAKKERLRKSRVAPDYISLDGGSNRVIGGSSDDEPEFQSRIALLGERTDGMTKGVFDSVDERTTVVDAELRVDGGFGGEDDDDEEDKIWEEEQFRKGFGKRLDDGSISNRGSNGIPAALVLQATQQQTFAYSGNAYHSTSSAPHVSTTGAVGVVSISRSAEVMSLSQQAEVATRALKEHVKSLKETHGRTMSSMTRIDENLSTSLLNITSLEKSLEAADEKFKFMQELRHFVSVICEFLQDKAPFIEELEEQMQKIHEERASAIIERRAADNTDEMTELEPAVTAAMPVLSRGGSASVVAAATTAAQAASAAAKERSQFPVQLDEFGRDVNQQKRMDLIRRAESRKLRKAQSESKRMSSIGDSSYQRIEGESSTDESDSESSAYQSLRDELLQTAEQVFGDADDEYSKLSTVKERMEKWKKYYLSSYRDAYMSLSAPSIFSPYVRLELLKWDPLYEDADFNNMQWHTVLFDYGLPENGSDFNPDDADANLIPGLVEKLALPILHHEIAHCWDMMSTRATKKAVSATNLVISYVPASSKALRELFAAIHTRLADGVADLTVPTWSTLLIRAVPDAARIAAYRFGMSVRLLKNICLWKDILALSVLEQLALDELLSGKILPHIRSVTPNIHDAITRTERIIASVSGVWSGPNVTAECSHKLQPLVDYITTLGKTLEKKHSSGGSSEETYRLALRLKKMLVELNEYDKARAVLRTFQLKEAV